MRKVMMTISYSALLMLIIPPCGVFLGKVDLDTSKHWMFVATILWFVTAPIWMGKEDKKE